ncbi:D-alanyl-D-alanine dipeptidase [Ignavibacterium album JCM 16511]|uniref:D-alanyl-D-alanine dipeptidase n=1 Tax=Ignavibacterium album (strain DSM 19864 / JCM 16511 / NBRC 101810 / Mat9-16) TaxID=945713 RepID=I0AJI7_IGNAJ|nr:M15 family metallopeptidase [Ignavibacterium album]AFH49144.1 D-alanyl-D-alanine dipeptidase [Ignavibacterium album JCM 16511]
MKTIFITFLIYIIFTSPFNAYSQIPDGFVEIREIIPDIVIDLRYYSNHNFLGRQVEGYKANKCYITKAAADSLAKVQEELKSFGLSLKVYDAYRPQRAVDDFVKWAKDLSDTLTRKEFYPTVEKSRLFADGYIAEKSGHSRGSTVDLTIVPIPVPDQPEFDFDNQCECFKSVDERFKDNSLDMGTGFDCFHPLSHTMNNEISPQQRANRMLLYSLMTKHGFKNLPEEWWHYTLTDEPYPDTYFDFVIE